MLIKYTAAAKAAWCKQDTIPTSGFLNQQFILIQGKGAVFLQ
jgi:hypothetical protein